MTKSEGAVFLDRDGTINEEAAYLNKISRFKLLPKASSAIRLLNTNLLKVVVVTNQAGVARGYFTETLVNKIHIILREFLEKENAYLDGIYFCPHHPDAGIEKYKKKCLCRKPNPGMLKKAANDLGIDLSKSYMVGDKISDIELGQNAGLKSILVLTGYGREELKSFQEKTQKWPDYIAEDLYDAVKWILKDNNAN